VIEDDSEEDVKPPVKKEKREKKEKQEKGIKKEEKPQG
jgi:hypothetical protein